MEENTSKVFVGRNSAVLTDPLLAPLTPSSPPSSLFVINLCASIAPVQTAGKTIPGFETYKLYQVARAEDGRTRHRLRLGFFPTEEDAERVLAAVRDNYPTAFVTCLSDDDRRFARGFLPDTETTASWKRPVIVPEKPVAKAAAAPAPVASAAASAPAAKAAAPARTPSRAVDAPAPDVKAAPKNPAPPARVQPAEDVTAIELSWDPPALEAPKSSASGNASAQTVPAAFKTETVIKASPAPIQKPAPRAPQTSKLAAPAAPAPLTLAKEPEPVRAPPAPPAAASGPFHVGKGIDIPSVSLSLEATAIQPSAAAKAPAASTVEPKAATAPKPPVQKPVVPAAKTTKPESVAVVPPAAARAAVPAPGASSRGPELDSTQTIRALTSAELNDDSQEKWYSIQLVVSERPVNLDAMPHLDIFEAYRVYSIANAGSGKIVYSLRLGFFREEVSAEAVSGYLRTFFPSPSVMRISAAEQARFKDAPAPKATAVAASKGEAKVIELNPARKPAAIPTVTMEVTDRSPTGTFKPNATGSFKVNASGIHKALKPAAKHAAPATKRSAPLSKTSATGKHKALQPKKSLQEQLLDEARDTILSESAIRKLPKNDSLLSRLVDKLTK